MPDYKADKRVVPISEMRPVAKLCEEHSGERLDLWCDECARPICQLCRCVGDHSSGMWLGHHLTPLSIRHEEVATLNLYTGTIWQIHRFNI